MQMYLLLNTFQKYLHLSFSNEKYLHLLLKNDSHTFQIHFANTKFSQFKVTYLKNISEVHEIILKYTCQPF